MAQILDNTITTASTLEGREAQLHALFTDISSFSDTARVFFEDNGDELVRLGEASAAQLRVLARYSTEFPCLTQGLVNVGKLEAEAFRGFILHIILETLPRQPRAYKAQDKPRTADNRGPNCLHLPNPPWSQSNPVRHQPDFNDGVDEPTGKGTSRAPFGDGDYRYSGSPADAAVLRQMLDADRLPGFRPRRADGRPAGRGGCSLMARLDKKTTNDLIKLVIFLLVTTIATSLLVITIGNISFSGTKEYKAQFSDATGVVKGDDIRIAGVKVGTVKKVEVVDETRALVTFTVDEGTDLTEATHASVRYRNLVGQRYISLSQEAGETDVLGDGATIPVDRTSPALDLTVLFNGFKPLFQALSPDDINKLSYEIVQVFQGEGGTLESLLGHTASITQTLADRDAVIGDLIDNLDFVLQHVADRDDQLSSLIINFRTLITGLKDDREAILSSLDGISELTVETADLIEGIRAPFVEDIKQLRRFAAITDKNKAELDRALQVLPIKLNKVGRTAIYGSWFNFYLCEFHGRVKLPANITVPIDYTVGAERCDLG